MTEEEQKAHGAATTDHRTEVWGNLTVLFAALTKAGMAHDHSKFEEPECSVFAETTAKLRTLTYGSEEYHRSLADLGPALRHHYDHNTHHPEAYANGVAGMDLVDLVEMFCDWLAATKRDDDGNMQKSITHNQERFKMDPQLACIFRNTYRRHFLEPEA